MNNNEVNSKISDILAKINECKVALAPVKKEFDRICGNIEKLQNKLNKIRLENGCWYSFEKLLDFKDELSKVEAICLVLQKPNGTIAYDWYFHGDDVLIKIDENNHFYYSSYEDGIYRWDEKTNTYIHDYYHSRTKLGNFVGLAEIRFQGEFDKYDVIPPDFPNVDVSKYVIS